MKFKIDINILLVVIAVFLTTSVGAVISHLSGNAILSFVFGGTVAVVCMDMIQTKIYSVDNKKSINFNNMLNLLLETSTTIHFLAHQSNNMKYLEYLTDINIGDYVLETSSPFKRNITSIGKLIDIKHGQTEKFDVYTIELFDGTKQDWKNCSFIKLPNTAELRKLVKIYKTK